MVGRRSVIWDYNKFASNSVELPLLCRSSVYDDVIVRLMSSFVCASAILLLGTTSGTRHLVEQSWAEGQFIVASLSGTAASCDVGSTLTNSSRRLLVVSPCHWQETRQCQWRHATLVVPLTSAPIGVSPSHWQETRQCQRRHATLVLPLMSAPNATSQRRWLALTHSASTHRHVTSRTLN